jgi:hypothetical protein
MSTDFAVGEPAVTAEGESLHHIPGGMEEAIVKAIAPVDSPAD